MPQYTNALVFINSPVTLLSSFDQCAASEQHLFQE
jgi:hypothetical protein